MANYKLTPAAEADLEEIWHYTVSTWSVAQAVAYTNALDKSFGLLAKEPGVCRERDEFSPPVRIYSHAHHRIVYLLAGNGITILRVVHERMDVDEQLN